MINKEGLIYILKLGALNEKDTKLGIFDLIP